MRSYQVVTTTMLLCCAVVVHAGDRGLKLTEDLSHASGKPGRYQASVTGIDQYRVRIRNLQTAGRNKGTHKAGDTFTESTTGMEFVWVAGGCFHMGDTFGIGDSDEKPMHQVCVDGFWLGKHEVTQGEWVKIMDYNPSHFKRGDDYPVETVSWDGAQAYIGKLNSRSGKQFRLPTEAEWEYAARSGGKKEKYAGTNSPKSPYNVAWYRINSGGSTRPACRKKANGLGIHDMSGNVWEWCADWYSEDYYSQSARNNPQGPPSGFSRVLRGGGWFSLGGGVRSTCRLGRHPAFRGSYFGFRLARDQ